MSGDRHVGRRVTFFGHFGQINFGNEGTLQAILYNLRRYDPEVDIWCVCTVPAKAAETHAISAVAIDEIHVKPQWLRRSSVARALRKILIGIPSEVYRWIYAFNVLKGTEMLIVPGTGLLTDAFGRISWGPYSVFKWSVVAKLRRCKVLFVSVGAGPIYTNVGRWMIRSALRLADFRSYRDEETSEFISRIGVHNSDDKVYPDLAFSLPVSVSMKSRPCTAKRIIGIGLMKYAGRLSAAHPESATYRAYLAALGTFTKWLLEHNYDIRLLIGDVCDRPVTQDFKTVLKEMRKWDDQRILDEPVGSVNELMSQIAGTDAVVATRYHNLLYSFLLDKPVISISFHQKCNSLMGQMGLSEYCQDIHQLSVERLIAQFQELEEHAERVKATIQRRTEEARCALDVQYKNIFGKMLLQRDQF